MILVCIRPFGNFVPGDEVEVPEGAEFDHTYFKPIESYFEPKSEEEVNA